MPGRGAAPPARTGERRARAEGRGRRGPSGGDPSRRTRSWGRLGCAWGGVRGPVPCRSRSVRVGGARIRNAVGLAAVPPAATAVVPAGLPRLPGRHRASGVRAHPSVPAGDPGLRPVGAARAEAESRAGPRPGDACPGGGPRDAAAPPAAARFPPGLWPRRAACPEPAVVGVDGAVGRRRRVVRRAGSMCGKPGGVPWAWSGVGGEGRRSGATAVLRPPPPPACPARARPPRSPRACACVPRPPWPSSPPSSKPGRAPACAAGSCSPPAPRLSPSGGAGDRAGVDRGLPVPGSSDGPCLSSPSPGLAPLAPLAPSETRPQIRRGDPLNLSILVSGGKETNQDSLSNGE